MRQTEILLDQLNRVFGGSAWHGPALRNLLDGVSEKHAKAHPIENVHSILELVVHVGTWMDVVARRLAGNVVNSTTVPDWSDVTTRSWPDTIEELERAQSRLSDAVARLKAENLEEVVPGKSITKQVEILGVIEHNVYHTGQISLLKKVTFNR
jgi:uncharacterized damage-inducible protein DinB